MPETDTLKMWYCFYSQFQNSKTFSQNHENNTVVVKKAGASLLLDTGKSFAFDLFKSCGLLGSDIIKLNHILWKLEEKCLPQVAVMFENFKRLSKESAASFNDIQSSLETETAVDLIDNELKGISALKETQGASSTESTNTGNGNKILTTNDAPFSDLQVENEKSRLKPQKATKKSDRNKSSLTQGENASKSVRRSGRSVKISSRFLDVGDKILKTIKRETLKEEVRVEPECEMLTHPENFPLPDSKEVAAEVDADLQVPYICSFCKESFLNDTDLLEHWRKHEENARGDNPFQCSLCEESFQTYVNLSSHFTECHSVNKLHQRSSSSKTPFEQKEEDRNDVKKHERCCPVCNVVLENEEPLEDHMCIHFPNSNLYFCDQCHQSFPTLGLIRRHVLSHLGLSLTHHLCVFCGKTFKLEGLLEAHIRKKHGNNCSGYIFQCPKCPKKFKTKDQLDFHSVRHSGVKPYFCENCGKTFLREKGLINHMRMHEGGGFMCSTCGKSFVSQRVLEDHMSIHTGEKPHVCDVCGKSFRLRANLRNHKQVHSTNKGIQCPHCPKTFRDGRSYSRHILMHTGERPWRCNVCGKGFVQEITLKKHMNLHNGENLHQCKICLRSFVDKWGLIKHSTVHTGEKPYECSVCHKRFRIKRGLEDHFKLHDISLQLACPLCPKTFVEKRHLDHHLRVHRGEKAYVCEICGDRFVNSMSLKVHLRRHTGEKPYKCSYCPKTFNQHGTHAAHERFHRGERPYACDFCDAAFITHSQLNIHRRKHLNIRPYKCSQCDYAATTASLLKVHSLKHSDEKPFRCPVCPAAFKRQNHLDVHARKHQAREEVVVGDESTSIIHISDVGNSHQPDLGATGTVTVVEVFQCSFCEASFSTQAALEAHMKRHEIIVVTAAANQDGIFEIPAIEGAHGASSEVAYDIVLL